MNNISGAQPQLDELSTKIDSALQRARALVATNPASDGQGIQRHSQGIVSSEGLTKDSKTSHKSTMRDLTRGKNSIFPSKNSTFAGLEGLPPPTKSRSLWVPTGASNREISAKPNKSVQLRLHRETSSQRDQAPQPTGQLFSSEGSSSASCRRECLPQVALGAGRCGSPDLSDEEQECSLTLASPPPSPLSRLEEGNMSIHFAKMNLGELHSPLKGSQIRLLTAATRKSNFRAVAVINPKLQPGVSLRPLSL